MNTEWCCSVFGGEVIERECGYDTKLLTLGLTAVQVLTTKRRWIAELLPTDTRATLNTAQIPITTTDIWITNILNRCNWQIVNTCQLNVTLGKNLFSRRLVIVERYLWRVDKYARAGKSSIEDKIFTYWSISINSYWLNRYSWTQL